MRILIVGGFLGSGKTSVILNIAREYVKTTEKGKVVIIENEIGEVGVDDKLLSAAGLKVKNLFSGCVCCSLAGDIVLTLDNVAKEIKPEMVIIEASGVGFPFNIKENIQNALGLESSIISVVDAQRWERLQLPLGTMLEHQLKDTNHLLINKIDLVDEKTVAIVCEQALAFCKDAEPHKISVVEGIDSGTINSIIG